MRAPLLRLLGPPLLDLAAPDLRAPEPERELVPELFADDRDDEPLLFDAEDEERPLPLLRPPELLRAPELLRPLDLLEPLLPSSIGHLPDMTR